MVVLKLPVMLPELTLLSPSWTECVLGVGAMMLGRKYWFVLCRNDREIGSVDGGIHKNLVWENVEEEQDYLVFFLWQLPPNDHDANGVLPHWKF